MSKIIPTLAAITELGVCGGVMIQTEGTMLLFRPLIMW